MLLGKRQPRPPISTAKDSWGCLLAFFVLLLGLSPAINHQIPLIAQSPTTPQLLISEVHPNPKAVDDPLGEWAEIMNPGTEAVNLQLWSLTTQGKARYIFPFEFWIPPGGYVVIARNQDPTQNGGVYPDLLYHSFSITNMDEQLSLLNPDGEIIDSVAWGAANGIVIPEGSSLERTAPIVDAPWALAHSPWPASKGDWGSPSVPYSPPPTATPTPTPPPAIPPRLLISEIMADPSAVSDELGEWVELYNGDTFPINPNQWILADLDGEKSILTGDFWLAPGSYAIIARTSDPAQNGGVTVQMSYTGLQLANEADELLLITPWGVQTDQLLWDANTNKIRTGISLERTSFEDNASWVTAIAPWPGSAGDWGSPGMPYIAPTPTPSPTSPPDTLPRLYISEIMADPNAIPDELGEWIELYNGDTLPINLNRWILADKDNERITLTTDLWIMPNSYLVLARSTDPAQNGGVLAQGSYTGLQLANEADELFLIAPWGVQIDEIVWDANTLRVTSGASLERTTFDATGNWVTATSLWPNSAGDRGSPGTMYIAPNPTPTPTATPTTEPKPSLPAGWSRRAQPSPLRIAQVSPQGSEQEYVVLHNWTGSPVPFAGWRMGDSEIPGNREGMYFLPADVILPPDGIWIAARHAATFRSIWGRAPDAEWGNSNPTVPQLTRDTFLSSGELALADDGDELLLLDPEGALADAVGWKNGNYAPLSLAGRLELPSTDAIYQVPNASYVETSDVRHRFAFLPADPYRRFPLPTPAPRTPVYLAEGMIALWGSLGASSTFSPGGKLPPHILMAAASANGLDFIAIADSDRAPTDMVSNAQSIGPTLLPAWRWQHPEGAQAVIYSQRSAILLGWGEVLQFLNDENALAQLPIVAAQVNQRAPLLSADTIYAPGGLSGLQKSWLELQSPILPAGNTTPPLPDESPIATHYTGIAATSADATAILEAITQRRGWLTSSPDLWLTLRTASNEWMGSTIAPNNALALEIAYGDRKGELTGIAIWQDTNLMQQLDIPPADGIWRLTIPAPPGTMIYAVATQLDGDFAITAPLYVTNVEGGRIVINEVLPAPGADHNGDGQVNSDDEYIELINVGVAPLALTNYALADAAASGYRFSFGTGRFIGAGERLLLWRKDTSLSLNDEADFVQLFDAEGNLIDQIAWEQRDRGPSISRLPDTGNNEGEWHMRTPPTPGQANQSYPPPEPVKPPKPDDPPIDRTDVRDPGSPTFGQAPGPAGSIALAKLRGLNSVVEFRAQVIVPPGLYPSAIYVAEAAPDENGEPQPIAGIGVQVYLRAGDFIPMQEGEWILVRGGVVKSFRGEMEIQIDEPGQAWPYETATALLPLPITISDIGESLEGRFVTFTGMVTGWQGDSIYLSDPLNIETPALRVTVRSSLGWRRPYVQKGELYQITGVVSQLATASPWNDGYRVLVRFPHDIQLQGQSSD